MPASSAPPSTAASPIVGGAPPRNFVTVGTAVAVVVIVASAIASGVAASPRSPHALVIAGGVAFGVLGTVGLSWAERREARWVWPVLGVQALIGMFVIAVCPAATLLVMPLVSCLVLYGSTRIACGATTALLGWFALVSLHEGYTVDAVIRADVSFGAAAAFVVVFSRILVRERQARADVERLAAEVARVNQQLREYAAKIEELATTKERNRVAREIHDGLGHCLTVASIQLEAARTVLERDPLRAAECIARAREVNQRGLEEVRRSVAMLREPIGAGRPLRREVSTLAEECSASGVPTTFVTVGDPRPLPAPLELALYRAAQEALTNVKRHAQASRAALTLSFDAGAVKLSVEDDGVGAAETDGGFGLLGVRERVALLGGSLEVRTAKGRGFALEVSFPT